MKQVCCFSEDCPKCYPCCGVSVPCFSHLDLCLNKSLPFLDDLFLKFALIIEQKSLNVSLDSEKDYDNNIYYYILSALLGGRSIYSKIKVNDREQRQLVDNIFKQSSTSSTVPYFVGIAEFLTNIDDEIGIPLNLPLPRAEMTDADSVDNTNTEIITHNNGRGVIIEEWENSNFNDKLSKRISPLIWTVFPGPWRVDGKGIIYQVMIEDDCPERNVNTIITEMNNIESSTDSDRSNKVYNINNNNNRNNIVNNGSISDSENGNINNSDSKNNSNVTINVVNSSNGENRVNQCNLLNNECIIMHRATQTNQGAVIAEYAEKEDHNIIQIVNSIPNPEIKIPFVNPLKSYHLGGEVRCL
ncbi:hypothetical protein H8356DRAFT_1327528 [Neocallimastix lanati (nom. inval.)]|nr:hypothetical protein H8356DRAFT_1327528 [Neocallimastix sp. JGI-2020a]